MRVFFIILCFVFISSLSIGGDTSRPGDFLRLFRRFESKCRFGDLVRDSKRIRVREIEIKTDRFVLRPLRIEDRDEIESIHLDPQVKAMSGDDSSRKSIDIKLDLSQDDVPVPPPASHVIFLGIYENGRLVGTVELNTRNFPPFLRRRSGQKNHWAEIGYHIRPNEWGRGIAGEAAQACKAYAFEQLQVNGLYGGALTTNAGSNHILGKTLKLPHVGKVKQKSQEYNFYALTREQYEAQK